MERPYIICHMVVSIDAKVTGDFLTLPECEKATDIYYEINRNYDAEGFICGRVTMEGSFTNGWFPKIESFKPVEDREDFICDDLKGFYAVSFDPKGRLGWKENCIVDDDPGYGGAQIIEVLTNGVDGRYLAYLKEMNIPYIFAGENEIDVSVVLKKLKEKFSIKRLLLEGGSIINGYFERENAIDELSLVVAPVVAKEDDKPLFTQSKINTFKLKEIKKFEDSVLWLNYRRN